MIFDGACTIVRNGAGFSRHWLCYSPSGRGVNRLHRRYRHSKLISVTGSRSLGPSTIGVVMNLSPTFGVLGIASVVFTIVLVGMVLYALAQGIIFPRPRIAKLTSSTTNR